MYKRDVVRKVAQETWLSPQVVSDVITATHRIIAQTLREKGRVTFPRFGTFYTSERRGGKIRLISTGKPVTYAPRRIALFRVGDVLKRAVKGKRRTSSQLLRNLLKRKEAKQ